ncbi:lysylphosphatidylglycerol synthase transmembrane domain-containing protein [Corynebacterium aquatimens]|uniref:Uncharacterized protein (TIRG00374 family) n=1 Tax=Corynebacterium aquatimens TaxID=1190508 RepID=A0A931E305_9CORY|nr:YbhN family protein [Corynebacterium aquatimens]MBG6122856.1 uncharacterized protein (TIRG00374 family) [Corynebacterium aquatimens]WJY66809.1 hypothetical protein CAQUA_10615 [Corynebacterium aquatimens]
MNASAVRKWVSWLAPVALLIVLLILFREQLPFLGQAFDALRHAEPLPVGLTVVSAFLAIVAMATVMRLLLRGTRATLWSCTGLTLASNAWSTTIPGGPAFSAWMTYRVQRTWGASNGLCGWFFVISGALSTAWMVLLGIAAVVFLGAELSWIALVATLLISVIVIAGLFWATLNPDVVKRWLRFVPVKLRTKLESVVDQVAAIRMSPGQFAVTALFSLLNRLCDVITLYLSVWAVTGTAPGTTAGLNETTIQGITLAFIMTKLAGMAQVTPGGLGTVEPVATAALVASGLTLVSATAATLIYRIVSFALITAIGWIIYFIAYRSRPN